MNNVLRKQVAQLLIGNESSEVAMDKVFELIYPKIKSIANMQLFKLNAGQTITPTVLVNECYLKLSKSKNLSFENEKHFIYTIARCMRQYLVDRIRQNNRQKRQGEKSEQTLTSIIGEDDIDFDLLDLDSIISKLDKINPSLSELTVLKYFSGYSLTELAKIQNVSRSTIMRNWKMAKSFITTLKQDI